MKFRYTRKIQQNQYGTSWVILPKAWVQAYGLKHGDEVEILAGEELIIRPLRKNITPKKQIRSDAENVRNV